MNNLYIRIKYKCKNCGYENVEEHEITSAKTLAETLNYINFNRCPECEASAHHYHALAITACDDDDEEYDLYL